MGDLLEQFSTYSRLIDNTVKGYDGSETNLQSFISQLEIVRKFFPAVPANPTPEQAAHARALQDFVISSVKSKITGYLATFLLPADNTLDLIIARVQTTVLRRDTEYYENQLLTIEQHEGQSTIDFLKLLKQSAYAVRRVYQISQGVNPQDPTFAERRAVTILKRNLMERARDPRVRQSMTLGTFRTIEDVLTKVAEFPSNAVASVPNAQVMFLNRGGNRSRRFRGSRGGFRYRNDWNPHFRFQRGNRRGRVHRGKPGQAQRGNGRGGKFNRNVRLIETNGSNDQQDDDEDYNEPNDFEDYDQDTENNF